MNVVVDHVLFQHACKQECRRSSVARNAVVSPIITPDANVILHPGTTVARIGATDNVTDHGTPEWTLAPRTAAIRKSRGACRRPMRVGVRERQSRAVIRVSRPAGIRRRVFPCVSMRPYKIINTVSA